MSYTRLTPRPFIDPDNPPTGYLKVGESTDQDRSKFTPQVWHFYVHQKYLIISIKEWVKLDDSDPGEYVIAQYEFPIAGIQWFVDTIHRFQLPADDPNAVPRDAFNVREEIAGETLGVTRGAGFGGQQIPGYSFDNLNRTEHSTVVPNGHRCQMFKMGDPWLFENGLLDLFQEIASRHESGEF